MDRLRTTEYRGKLMVLLGGGGVRSLFGLACDQMIVTGKRLLAARALCLYALLFFPLISNANELTTINQNAVIKRIVMTDNSTYFVGLDGRVFVMGDVTLWGNKVKGYKGCPVLYSFCSDAPIQIDLDFRVKSLVGDGRIVYLLSTDGNVFLHGFNYSGKAGLDFSSQTSHAEKKFDLFNLPYPELIMEVFSTPISIFALSVSGTVYFSKLQTLTNQGATERRVEKIDRLPPIQSLKSRHGMTIAQDFSGSLWKISEPITNSEISIYSLIKKEAVESLRPSNAIDFEIVDSSVYVLYHKANANAILCYSTPSKLNTQNSALLKLIDCPSDINKLVLPQAKSMKLNLLSNQSVVAVDENSQKTYFTASNRLKFSLPWLQIHDYEQAINGVLYSHNQRYVLIKENNIYLVGDNTFMESGASDGNTSFKPFKLQTFNWSN